MRMRFDSSLSERYESSAASSLASSIGFTKNHVMLETKKEEVILPEVQIPTADDTEKEEVILK